MVRTSTLVTLGMLLAALAAGQDNMPLIEENSTRVSDHVWAIVGWPNIAIVVGNRATLVVDTGLGPRHGAPIMRVVKKLSTTPTLFLTPPHFHVEHTTGQTAFPADPILMRPDVQPRALDTGVGST